MSFIGHAVISAYELQGTWELNLEMKERRHPENIRIEVSKDDVLTSLSKSRRIIGKLKKERCLNNNRDSLSDWHCFSSQEIRLG